MPDRLALPPRPPAPEPQPFPIVGVAAPVVLAAVLFAVLRTPTVLLLAVFSPVLAVAAVLDGRLQLRRRGRRDADRHDAALTEIELEIAGRIAAAVTARRREAPSPAMLAADAEGWAGRPPSGRLVLGDADLPGEPLLTGAATTERERAVVARGSTLPGAPLTVPAETTVGVVGPAVLTAAFDRALAVGRLRGGGVATGCTVLETLAGASADLVVHLEPDGGARVLHASGPAADLPVRAFRPAYLTAAAHAGAVGARGAAALADLLRSPASGGLAARFLLGGGAAVDLDLVADGPHAVVGGTTGSGKSALLTAWVLALAAAHPPDRLVLLLVDHKGGATFDPLAGLPHVAGVVTDLDGGEAERAVVSLRAELRRREEVARRAGAADAVAAGLPRLVVVVDEYRALVDGRPELGALFADLAARGRSLGVHLILCTQRPGTAVRDEVLANCAVRLCLRVQDRGDSIAVVGTDAAARLGRDPVGAAVLAVDGVRSVRVVGVDPGAVRSAVREIAARHPGAVVDRPWLPPLPERLPMPAAPAGLVALGLVDLPEEQRRPVLAWDPVAEPRLLVAGDPGSGRSGALRAAAAGLGVPIVAGSPIALWDRLADRGLPLLVDDLDHLLDRLGEQHAARAAERLAERLRDPGAAPTVVTVRGPGAWAGLPLRALPGLFDGVLLLRLGLDDHLALGGARASWDERAVPGRGRYAGRRVQIGLAPPATLAAPEPAGPLPDGPVALISARPVDRATRLIRAGRTVRVPGAPLAATDRDVAVVGSPAEWQAQWQSLPAVRAAAAVLVDGCGAADVRTLLGVTDPLPPVEGSDVVVSVPLEGDPVRVRLPGDSAQ